MSLQGRVILIDHRKAMHAACRQILEANGFSMTTAETGVHGLEKVRQESFDVALLNPGIPDMPGLEVLRRLKQESPNTAVILITDDTAGNEAAAAKEEGALDCLPEPFTPDMLAGLVEKAKRYSRRVLEDSCIGQELERKMLSQVLIGRSESMERVGRFIRKAATVDTPVLITGEPGTGKDLVARAIHRLSRRSHRRFVTVDCETSTENLLESELFGHTGRTIPGRIEITAGKIELAEGGTLFLDRIAAIGSSIQEKLLKVILGQTIPDRSGSPERNVDIRIISSTNRDMLRETGTGKFREDLFYRLNSLHIPLPPLREHLDDIPLLADYYIRKFSVEKQIPARSLSEEAMLSLKRRAWPGNVRELIQVLEYAVDTCEGLTIEPRNLPLETQDLSEAPGETGGYLARLERDEILRILDRFGGNKTKAAKFLGINRKTLREKMERYGLNT
ncbi:MAG: sigma-54-dependent Fis family transcriptional regulator [Acidobacteria bacterium]|nr:sigma-54-dependent Fis family transcriptional regulator [Acidobacteriota bacterium]